MSVSSKAKAALHLPGKKQVDLHHGEANPLQ